MFCPECGAEFREGIERCSDCGVELVPSRPAEVAPGEELVAVFETAEVAALPVLKSALEAAGIPFLIQGEETFGLFPLNRVGGLIRRRGLGVAILVPGSRRQEALEVLAGAEEAPGGGD